MIALGCDHGGYELMQEVKAHLTKRGFEFKDFGCYGTEAVDYPEYGRAAAEAVAANHMGMKVCGISCITNMASGILAQPLSHIEVQETADRVAVDFKKLVTEAIINIHKAM